MPPKKDFYCGKAENVPDKYERHGSRYECLKRGFGAGMYSEKKKYEEEKDDDDDESRDDKKKKKRKQTLNNMFRALAQLLDVD